MEQPTQFHLDVEVTDMGKGQVRVDVHKPEWLRWFVVPELLVSAVRAALPMAYQESMEMGKEAERTAPRVQLFTHMPSSESH